MMPESKHSLLLLFLLCCTVGLFFTDLLFGPVRIPAREVFQSLTGGTASKTSWEYIITNYRLPKAFTAVLAGTGLSVSGLLMQTLFRNPLAGPYVLGLSSGSSLGVAFVILGAAFLPVFLSGILLSPYGIVIASCIGSCLVLLAVILVSRKLRDTSSILIVGLMFGSFATAVVGILSYFSSAEQLQKFTFWALGNLGNLSWASLGILTLCVSLGLLLAFSCVKSLDALLLGENYAKSLGLNYPAARFKIILSTSLLAGSITAFAGPIAFVGLAVPHMARLIFQTSRHAVLFMGTLLLGACILLICDLFCQFPGSETVLPINAITSIIGAPVVIWLLLRKRNLLS